MEEKKKSVVVWWLGVLVVSSSINSCNRLVDKCQEIIVSLSNNLCKKQTCIFLRMENVFFYMPTCMSWRRGGGGVLVTKQSWGTGNEYLFASDIKKIWAYFCYTLLWFLVLRSSVFSGVWWWLCKSYKLSNLLMKNREAKWDYIALLYSALLSFSLLIQTKFII